MVWNVTDKFLKISISKSTIYIQKGIEITKKYQWKFDHPQDYILSKLVFIFFT